jgi:hypothetical protein
MLWRSLAPEYPIVEAVHAGQLRYEDAIEIRDVGIAMAIEHQTFLLLLDLSSTTRQPPAELIVEIADSLAQLGVSDRLREAIVRPTDVTAAVWADLFVKAAVNRGLTVSLQRDRESAIAWLLA